MAPRIPEDIAGDHRDTVRVPLPTLPTKAIFAMTSAYFGVHMAFSLQGANTSRVAQTIGADPSKLGFFFILPPLVGMIVQPVLGRRSDRTWNRFGRRMPHLLFGAPAAAIIMILLPFSGSFGFGYGSLLPLLHMASAICLLDVLANVWMCRNPGGGSRHRSTTTHSPDSRRPRR